jgi:hypothetical protein
MQENKPEEGLNWVVVLMLFVMLAVMYWYAWLLNQPRQFQ